MKDTYSLDSTKEFKEWFKKLEKTTKGKIALRFARIEEGNLGDCKTIGENLYELRFFFNSGVRVYFTIQRGRVVMLLIGGVKDSQAKDIERAKEILRELE